MCTTIKGHVGMSAGGHLRQDPVHWWSPKEIRLNPIYGDRKWCVTWIGGHRKVYWLSCCVTPFDCYRCCIVHCYLFGLSTFLPMYVWSPGLQLNTFMVARKSCQSGFMITRNRVSLYMPPLMPCLATRNATVEFAPMRNAIMGLIILYR